MNNFFNNLNIFFKKIFSITNIDSHLLIYIFGIRIRKKLKLQDCELEIKDYGLDENNKNKTENRLILSLTSFPERINIVHKTIITLLKQTKKPDKVLLYLANEQFKNKEDDLPESLLNLKKYGLEIKWTEDLRSYKKLIPAMKEFPNDIIITFDDDIYYPNNIVENLYNEYLKNPNYIYANRVRRFYLKNDELYSDSSAKMYFTKYNDYSYLNKLTGMGGVLYPPKSLNDEVFNIEKFKKIIYTQDDVWFWAMAVLNHTKIKMVMGYDINLQTIGDSQKYGLSKINSSKGKGINSLDAARLMIKYYPEILDIIKKD